MSEQTSLEAPFSTLVVEAPITNRPLGAELLDSPIGKGEFEEICWRILRQLPGSLRLGQITTLEFADAEGEHRRFEFDSRFFPADSDEPVGQIMVSLYRKPGAPDDEVYLELEQGQVWLPEMRGKGVGKAIAENARKLGLHLGVKAVTALAMYDGRWVWPMLGFKFGDYLPEERSRRKFLKAFRAYCRRHNIALPAAEILATWDAPEIARFSAEIELKARLGHPTDDTTPRQSVSIGRAFLQSRRPFFVTYPLQ